MVQLCKVCDKEFTGDFAGMTDFNNSCGKDNHEGKLK